jgi:hypothetical protein
MADNAAILSLKMARKKPKKFDSGQFVRELARERVGRIPAAKPILPKSKRKKPKHKEPPDIDSAG